MKRLILLSSLIAAMVCLSGTFVVADSSGGAAVAKDWECVLTPAQGLLGSIFTTDSHRVVTPSGNVKITCHFDFDPALLVDPKRATKSRDFLCSTGEGLTNDSSSVVTPAGTATLVCQIKPDAD